MTDDKRRWVPIFFPLGKFEGSVNLRISGASAVTAETAKQMIDIMEAEHNATKDSNPGSACSERETKVS